LGVKYIFGLSVKAPRKRGCSALASNKQWACFAVYAYVHDWDLQKPLLEQWAECQALYGGLAKIQCLFYHGQTGFFEVNGIP